MSDENEDIRSQVVIDPPTSINFKPSDIVVLPPISNQPAILEDDVEKDFKKAQSSIKESMDLANVAMKDLAQMAQDSNHPKVYEMLNALIRTVAQNSRDLIEIHKRVKEIKHASEPQQITNNNLILTTAEMIESIKKSRET
jgi:hypothetical protein